MDTIFYFIWGLTPFAAALFWAFWFSWAGKGKEMLQKHFLFFAIVLSMVNLFVLNLAVNHGTDGKDALNMFKPLILLSLFPSAHLMYQSAYDHRNQSLYKYASYLPALLIEAVLVMCVIAAGGEHELLHLRNTQIIHIFEMPSTLTQWCIFINDYLVSIVLYIQVIWFIVVTLNGTYIYRQRAENYFADIYSSNYKAIVRANWILLTGAYFIYLTLAWDPHSMLHSPVAKIMWFLFTMLAICGPGYIIKHARVTDYEYISAENEPTSNEMEQLKVTFAKLVNEMEDLPTQTTDDNNQAPLDQRTEYEIISKKILNWTLRPDKPFLQPGLTIGQVANDMHVRELAFSSFLNNERKMNFLNWINTYRIQEAKSMLEDPECTKRMNEIAFHCGFADGSVFGRAFKKQEGCTPLEYRKSKTEEQ